MKEKKFMEYESPKVDDMGNMSIQTILCDSGVTGTIEDYVQSDDFNW